MRREGEREEKGREGRGRGSKLGGSTRETRISQLRNVVWPIRKSIAHHWFSAETQTIDKTHRLLQVLLPAWHDLHRYFHAHV
jgi:hypothetical protein